MAVFSVGKTVIETKIVGLNVYRNGGSSMIPPLARQRQWTAFGLMLAPPGGLLRVWFGLCKAGYAKPVMQSLEYLSGFESAKKLK